MDNTLKAKGARNGDDEKGDEARRASSPGVSDISSMEIFEDQKRRGSGPKTPSGASCQSRQSWGLPHELDRKQFVRKHGNSDDSVFSVSMGES